MIAAPDREFREIPTFTGLEAASFCFAFALETRQTGKKGDSGRTAYRLLALARELEEDRGEDGGPDIHRILVEPVRSFLDDVTNGPPGVNGRPLLFLASGAHRAIRAARSRSCDRRAGTMRPKTKSLGCMYPRTVSAMRCSCATASASSRVAAPITC